MIIKLRILRARIRRTLHDYRVIWRSSECGRLAHLRKQWRASAGLVVVSEGKVWELPF